MFNQLLLGTSSPGWPLENGVFFEIHAYVKLIAFANLPFWQLRLRFDFFQRWILLSVGNGAPERVGWTLDFLGDALKYVFGFFG